MIMFFGQFMCLGFYLIKTTYLKEERKLGINPLVAAIPACIDICASTLMFAGLTMCAASIYQMMRAFVVVATAGLSKCILGK